MKIAYTLHARSDLHGIYEYIANILISPASAQTTVSKIMREIRSLESMPARNPLYKDEPWHNQGVRVLSVKKYLIFYTVNTDSDTVTVARVIYGGRNLNRQLEETEEWGNNTDK